MNSQDSQNQFTELPKLSNDEELSSHIKQETTDNIIEVDHSADSKENQGVHIFKPALDLVDVKIEEKEDDENKPIKVKKARKKSKKASSLHDGAF
jgi:hypothetical protein